MMPSGAEILTSGDKFHIELGLNRISEILNLLGDPQDKLKCIHIAGTNGKGSVCAILNQILIEYGLNVGLYTSPHLFSYTERIKINNKDISQRDFDKLVNEISALADKNQIHLTEFEILTAAAFKYFSENNLDIVILETGLGGRLDATNVIKKPFVTIITTIDFDHTDRLGDTIEKIAAEKAGIIKNPSPCIIGENNLGLNVIKEKSNNLIVVQKAENKNLSLHGEHQKENLALALGAIKYLPYKIKKETIDEALKKVQWRFRLEYHKDKNILIDGAHNPSGIKTLRNFLDKNFQNQKITFIFGCLKTKDYKKMLDILLKENDDFYYCEFNHNASIKFDDLDIKYKKRAKKCDINNLPKTEDNVLKVYCGSLYMLGEIFR